MTSSTTIQTTETTWFLDALATVHVAAEQAGGTHAVIEFVGPLGTRPADLAAGA